MSDRTTPDRPPSPPAQDSGSVSGALVAMFALLMFGIVAGFSGLAWGRFLAFAAFGVLFLLATFSEGVGWKRALRRRGDRPVPRLRRPKKSARIVAPFVTATPRRERIENRSPDTLERAGTMFMWLIVVVVLLSGVAWVMMFLASRERTIL